jgi:hypothetical protein
VTQPSFHVDPEMVARAASAVNWISRFYERTDLFLGDEHDRPGGEEAFGEYGALAAYREFFRRWKAEVQVTGRAAAQFDADLMTAVGNYVLGDRATAQRFGSR